MQKTKRFVTGFLITLLVLFLTLSLVTDNWKFLLFSIVPIAIGFTLMVSVTSRQGRGRQIGRQ
ncbi:hypothetical protein [Sporosarcina koreensis]|uniref:hypothetical protein n=1 Tax=Sporosarcina koreensis TaxID=334735 RepID=UPI00058B66D8|nr:hypothetical protein [Sporosarcina koreensis]